MARFVALRTEPTSLDGILHVTNIVTSRVGWFFPPLKNFFDTFNDLMQAVMVRLKAVLPHHRPIMMPSSQNVKSTNADLLVLVRGVKYIHDMIANYGPIIGTFNDSTCPFDSILQDTTE